MKRGLTGVVLVVCVSLVLCGAMAGCREADAEWPEGVTVKLIVPFSPGGLVDVFARGLAPHLGEELGVSVVVENMPGAGTRIGNEHVYAQPPDGTTFLVANNAELAFGEIVYETKYKTDEFTYIDTFFLEPPALVVGADSPFETLSDLIEAAKTSQIRFGVIGSGGYYHLQALLLQDAAGVEFAIVPFKGGAPISTNIQGGHIDVGIVGFGFGVAQQNAGTLRVIAQVGAEHPEFPELPTVRALLPEFEGGGYIMGLMGPPELPAAIQGKMADAYTNAVGNAEFKEWAEDKAMFVVTVGSEQYKKQVAEFKAQYMPYKERLQNLATQ